MEEYKQWCDYRRIFLASHSALLLVLRALVYREGPANLPVLQASTYRVLKALTYRTYSTTDMYMTIATTALKSNSSNSPKTYI